MDEWQVGGGPWPPAEEDDLVPEWQMGASDLCCFSVALSEKSCGSSTARSVAQRLRYGRSSASKVVFVLVVN